MTQEEITRLQEIGTALTDPALQARLQAVLTEVNFLYDEMNMVGQIHSFEDGNGRSFRIRLEDVDSFPGKTILTIVNANGTVVAPTLLEPDNA